MANYDSMVNVSFRLNLDHDEENDIWKAIRRVDEDKTVKYIYGSRSGFIKQMLAMAIQERKYKEDVEKDCQIMKEELWDKLIEKFEEKQKSCNQEIKKEITEIIEKSVVSAVQNAIGSLVLGMQLAGTVSVPMNVNPVVNASMGKEPISSENYQNEALKEKEEDFFKPDESLSEDVASFLDQYGD